MYITKCVRFFIVTISYAVGCVRLAQRFFLSFLIIYSVWNIHGKKCYIFLKFISHCRTELYEKSLQFLNVNFHNTRFSSNENREKEFFTSFAQCIKYRFYSLFFSRSVISLIEHKIRFWELEIKSKLVTLKDFNLMPFSL